MYCTVNFAQALWPFCLSFISYTLINRHTVSSVDGSLSTVSGLSVAWRCVSCNRRKAAYGDSCRLSDYCVAWRALAPRVRPLRRAFDIFET